MIVDPESVAVALDMFPDWDENMRAEVYHAIDVAPDDVILAFNEAKTYFNGEAHAAWMRIREYVLAPNDGKRWAYTLHEASGFESAPTKRELLESLWRGSVLIR